MSLLPGTRLGPYEVIAAVGAGGMGEVYRGRDTRLDRTVAIKVLPDAVAQDPERLARFEREAKTLAALNHTNIAQIYGIEENALAMEFVEGEDLSARIARGPLPIDEALDVARQIAEALDAAHALGIVHRDLKPSNIRIRDDGTVKVLDFGLAKALSPAMDLIGSTSAPTVTSPAMTGLGAIIGTAVYMAPEQAKGRAVDKRGDIWAFGVVLYEMVTGRRPFDGETVSEVLAAVIKSEPDWSPVPPQLHRLLKSCLEKDPRKRLRDIGDWTRQVDEPAAARPRVSSGTWFASSAAAILLVMLGGLGVTHFREAPPALQTVRFQIPAPDGNSFEPALAIAPDGRRVAFVARDEKGTTRLWLRDFDALESRPIAGTEGARNVFWKPDSSYVAFVVDKALKKVPVAGGPVVTLFEGPGANVMGLGAWSSRGVILIGGITAGVMRTVPESGGDFTRITALDPTRGDAAHGLPSMLPDGQHFLYLRVSLRGQSGIFIGSLDKKAEDQSRDPILTMEGRAAYAEMGPQGGRLLFLKDGTLMAQPFDLDQLAPAGLPAPIAEQVGNTGAYGLFSATTTALAYRTGGVSGTGQESKLTWLDRDGKTVRVLGAAQSVGDIELAPDGRRAAMTLLPSMNTDVWIAELDPYKLVRLTTSPTSDRKPIWSPDGFRIAFFSNRNGGLSDLFVKPVNTLGGEVELLKSDKNKAPTSWSHDGRFLLYTIGSISNSDVWLLPMEGNGKTMPILQTEAFEAGARFSPDGRWIAYQSNRSGRPQIYVQSFDPASPASPPVTVKQVSADGGVNPSWPRDGKELFFVTPGARMMAVDVTTVPALKVGEPHELFPLPGGAWDVTSDGKRFLVAVPTGEESKGPITIVLNWGALGSR